MLKIKLARFGKKHQAHYRIVVNEARDKRDGQYVALLGHYSPVTPKKLEVDVKAFEEWVKKGAQPTETVAALFKRFQSGTPFPVKKAGISRKAKAKLEAAKSAEAVAKPAEPVVEATEPAVETPVVEPKVETKVEEVQAQ